MLSFLTILKNEFLSYFVPEKMEYKITGKCLKCGKSFQKESPELVKKYKNISNQVNQRVISE